MNRTVRSSIRTSLKKLRGAASKEDAAKELPNLFSLLDKAARRNQGDITKNAASNYKRKAHLAVANWAAAAAAKAPSKKPATKAKVRTAKAK